MTSVKHVGEAPSLNGVNLRIAIVHARWNPSIISPLVTGCIKALLSTGVKRENIITESVPGSWELPFACQRVYAASQTQSATTSTSLGGLTNLLSAGDLLGASASTDDLTRQQTASHPASVSPSQSQPPPITTSSSTTPFDAIIAIGVLIKGETKHFEYISKATTEGLMRVQLETGVPIVLGVLTCITEAQAQMRAGIGQERGVEDHNHGEDWGRAAVEMGSKRRTWGEGRFAP